jgi:hypothetical protein
MKETKTNLFWKVAISLIIYTNVLGRSKMFGKIQVKFKMLRNDKRFGLDWTKLKLEARLWNMKYTA